MFSYIPLSVLYGVDRYRSPMAFNQIASDENLIALHQLIHYFHYSLLNSVQRKWRHIAIAFMCGLV